MSSGSANRRSSVRCHHSSNATDSWIASSTSNPGGSAGLQRVLGEDRCANAWSVRDRGVVEPGERAAAYGPSPPSLDRALLDPLADPFPQLGRGRGGERDDREVARRGRSRQQRDDPFDELRASSRCPRRRRRSASARGRCGSRSRTAWSAGARVTSSSSRPAQLRRTSTTAGSRRFASNIRSRSGEQSWSKSQNPHSSNEPKNGFSLPGYAGKRPGGDARRDGRRAPRTRRGPASSISKPRSSLPAGWAVCQ